jgi:tRNA A37 N6-isopentenylltransferase MiaA
MEQLAIQNGPEWLHDKLKACDPVTAARLHLNDMRRIIRALEVFELTGRPISEDQQHTPVSGGRSASSCRCGWSRLAIGCRAELIFGLIR